MGRHRNTSGLPWLRELIIFLVCFTGVYAMNVVVIIQNHSPAKEVLTRLHVVLLLALSIYGLVIVLRVLYKLVTRFWNRR